MKIIAYIFCFFTGIFAGWGQQVEKAVLEDFALINAEIHTVTKGVITGDLIVINGMITSMGKDLDIPENIRQIECNGANVYPGMIDGGTALGLSEIGSISLTQDANEIGNINPHMNALTAVNPNSVVIPVTRVNGITTVLTQPSGGLFSGQAALINLHGYTPQQMFASYQAVRMNWPSTGKRGRWDRRSELEIKKDAEEKMDELNEIWEKAGLYAKLAVKPGVTDLAYNPELASIASVLKKEMKLHVEVNKDEDILKALSWLKDKDIEVILTGVKEGWRVKDSILKSGFPVIVGPVLSVPSRDSDPYEMGYANAGVLAKAGILTAIRTNESENVRNLPYHAGFAANYGMGKEAALEAITINPARIFGVEDKYGSIEVGKHANLFVCDGDPFETKTQLSYLFIEGWNIPLESRQSLLYNEFLRRVPGLKTNK